MPTDIEIARSVTPLPITEVAKNAGVDVKHLIPYGFDKAKVDYSLLNEPTDHQAKLVLVTAINPTPAGEGKTTTTIGLADGLRRRGGHQPALYRRLPCHRCCQQPAGRHAR